jgi:F-type H+-transporting ATPase subunit a
MFDGLAKSNSPHRNKFLGAYVFAAGVYIFISTLFELFGLQTVTTEGASISLPAPLSDINAAIAMGCISYLVIMSGGIAGNGLKGIGLTLKDFSLPISMSFRLFGALLSGLLVTEMVYYYIHLSFVLPVIVGVMFTLLHALIQAYVLTMLTALFYGEVSEKHEKHKK